MRESTGMERSTFFILDQSLKDTDGHIVKLDDFAGKMLAVCFVATWDAPSQKQIAILSDWLRVHDDRELAVLGLAIRKESMSGTWRPAQIITCAGLMELDGLIGRAEGSFRSLGSCRDAAS